jgi:plasmid stabilization system protein ParE
MKLEWSAAALADLDRFAAFLQERHPVLASIVAREILSKAEMLEAHPQLGYPIGRGGEYRQVVLRCCEPSTSFAIALPVNAS